MASSARIDELKKKFDENPRRYFAPLANEFRKSGDLEQAILVCEEFLPQQPGHMSGHIVYGQSLYESSRMGDARTVFETALGLDPENLIALRHLGDIAREEGDAEAALRWYVRVLDADPRNEEIQALIASFASAPEEPLVASLDSAQAHAELPRDSNPVDMGVSESPPFARDDPALLSTVAEEFTLDGFESTFTEPAAASPPTERAHGLEMAHFDDPDPTESALIDAEASFEKGISAFAVPAALSADSATPLGLESHGVSLASPDDESAEWLDVDQAETLPPHGDALTPRAEAVLAEQSPAVREAPIDDAAWHGDPFVTMDVVPEFELSASVVAAEAELIDAELAPTGAQSPGPTSAPFVTETMAELYLQQGFREEALAVYQQLSEANPSDARLRARLDALEPRHVDVSSATEGPSIRDFLRDIAARRPRPVAVEAAPSLDDFAAFEAVPEVASSAVAEPPRAIAAVPAVETRPSLPPEVAGSIDALFGTRPGPASEDSAASALAQAFGSTSAAAPPISGRPARAGSGELSLDSIFRDGGGARPPRASQSFSFDQFFAGSAASEGTPSAPGAGAVSEPDGAPDAPAERSPQELEQFNSWLQGLKPR